MKNTSCSNTIKQLLYTLQESNRLSYQKSLHRSPKSILRLYNIAFLHAISCFSVFGEAPKLPKLYGIYFHAITVHLPEVARIISPSSLDTENEERIFSILNSIGLTTSTRHAESIRDNGIIRLQAEKEFMEQNMGETTSSINSKISKFSTILGMNFLIKKC